MLLCCTNGFAGFLSLTLKVNGYLRSTLKRLPLGASEDLTPEGRTSSTTLLHSPTLERNGWKCFKWYHSWRYPEPLPQPNPFSVAYHTGTLQPSLGCVLCRRVSCLPGTSCRAEGVRVCEGSSPPLHGCDQTSGSPRLHVVGPHWLWSPHQD